MSPDVIIRRLGPDDADVWFALRLEALRTAPAAFAASHVDEVDMAPDIRRARVDDRGASAVFGAFRDGTLVGVAGMYVEAGEKRRHKGVLWGVYVQPAMRGRGLGQRLVSHVIRHAREKVLVLHAGVGTGNRPARDLYHRLGFRPYGIERRALRIGDAFVDEELLVIDTDAETTDQPPNTSSSCSPSFGESR